MKTVKGEGHRRIMPGHCEPTIGTSIARDKRPLERRYSPRPFA